MLKPQFLNFQNCFALKKVILFVSLKFVLIFFISNELIAQNDNSFKNQLDQMGLGYDFTGFKKWSDYKEIFNYPDQVKDEIDRIKLITKNGFYYRALIKSNQLLQELKAKYSEGNTRQSILEFEESIYLNISSAYLNLKKYEDSKYYLDKAKSIFQKIEPSNKSLERRFKYEELYEDFFYRKKDYGKAIEYALIQLNHSEYYEPKTGVIATMYYAQGNYESAIEFHKRFSNWNENELSKYGVEKPPSLDWFIGNSYLANNEPIKAENYLYPIFTSLMEKEIRNADDLSLLKLCLFDLAIINSLKGNTKDSDLLMSTYLKNYPQSIFEHLITKTELDRNNVLLDNYYNPDIIFNFLSKRPSNTGEVVGEGYNVALLSKLLLLETSKIIPQVVANSKNNVMREFNSRLLNIKHSLKSLDPKEKDSLTDFARYYEKEILETWREPILKGLKESLVSWKTVQENLEYGEAAIEFVNFRPYHFEKDKDEIYYGAFLLRKDIQEPKFINLFSKNELDKTLKPINASNRTDSEKVKEIYTSKAKELYEIIWKPLEDNLESIKKIYYSPAGILNSIAFSALKNSEGVTLSEKFRFIRLVNTKNILNTISSKKFSGASLFGDVAYNNEQNIKSIDLSKYVSRSSLFQDLPGTKREVEQIEKILSSNNIIVHKHIGNEASEQILFKESSNPSINVLHIASHAFYLPPLEDKEFSFSPMIGWAILKESDDSMNRSGLALSGANQFWKTGVPIKENGYDGILTANEISNLDLNGIELAVLSACETALGDFKDNEGVIGLQRGLKMAGVNYLLLSLWKVDDTVTEEFMVEFYKNLIYEKYVIETAFYKTQKKIKSKYTDPYFWASFVLIK